MNWLMIKLHRRLHGQGPGIIRVRAGKDGAPQEQYWRDRLKDAAIDGCCELIEPEKISKKTKGVTDG